MEERKFYVYMLRCKDRSLYTGYTIDLEKRLSTHQEGKASKYTRSRGPVTLVYFEEFESKSEAMRREIGIKQLNKRQKEELIKSEINLATK